MIILSVAGSVLWSFSIRVSVYSTLIVSSVGAVVHGVSQMKYGEQTQIYK